MAHINHAYLDTSGGLNGSDESQSRRLNSLSPTFFISPKTTGLASLFIQVVLIIVSATTSMFFFYHVGGYEYTQWNENSTILEPINHNNRNPLKEFMVSTITPNVSDSLVSTVNRSLDFSVAHFLYNDSDVETYKLILETDNGQSMEIENASFGIEQVPMTNFNIGDTDIDWLEVIRISTLVYVVICAFWVISGLLFICTIKCEILDTVIFNTTVLILVVLFQFVHSGLIAALIFLQREMSWRTLLITIMSIIIIFCCAILGSACIKLNFGWIKYIDHMHGTKKCHMFCCGRSNEPKDNGHAEPREIPVNAGQYENDVPLDRFDAF
ncbi:unnamed protein product [Caenorhabditis nigoni]|uniref:Uncharacterized protein n=2 Tax=Caenorhabditis nigoni TaxID=1611254 RepID=A0A2G5SJ71_9PELO|nr:hypothetical protein B9Z55_022235 [Caenorhabditis nigoni]